MKQIVILGSTGSIDALENVLVVDTQAREEAAKFEVMSG